MDVQLQELIDKIKKDGVASAEASAASIISEAEKKAASIISEAETKAAEIVKQGKTETARMEKASIDAIRQAGRNLILSFRDSISAELNAIISTKTASVYSADMLKTLIPETVKAWAKNTETEDISVLLPAKDVETLESSFKSALKAELAKGLELKADKTLDAGFRIGSKDGSAYYDFSAEAVADLFSAYLNPKTVAIMKEAAQQIGEGSN
ncbi:MAG: V-type ATP synthase subunit E [Spirochaetaceae bacterium]|nr:V-type ATP synthase subunit E [Spirochaetaceae bacterium]